MKAISTIVHFICMLWPSYARNFRAEGVLKALSEKIQACEHCRADIAGITVLLGSLSGTYHERALVLLADANNFDCKRISVDQKPEKFGAYCADQLIEMARGYLKFSGCADQAMRARKRLFVARQWYTMSRALTQELSREIKAGLEATEWVTSRKGHRD